VSWAPGPAPAKSGRVGHTGCVQTVATEITLVRSVLVGQIDESSKTDELIKMTFGGQAYINPRYLDLYEGPYSTQEGKWHYSDGHVPVRSSR